MSEDPSRLKSKTEGKDAQDRYLDQQSRSTPPCGKIRMRGYLVGDRFQVSSFNPQSLAEADTGDRLCVQARVNNHLKCFAEGATIFLTIFLQ